MDIGYHFDLTQQILKRNGFSQDAISLALFANGITDLIGNSPIAFSDFVMNAKKMHCDNLTEEQHVTNYWKQLLYNLKALLESPQTSDIQAIMAIGVVLHALQDLCSHSNWCSIQKEVSRHSVPDLGIPTEYLGSSVFSDGGFVKSSNGNQLLTGLYEYNKKWEGWIDVPTHGSHCQHGHAPDEGIHLDHQDRRGKLGLSPGSARYTSWDEAYVLAFVSSNHLVAQALLWSKPSIKNLELTGEQWIQVQYYMEFLKKAFGALKLEGHDGHWKGPGSGAYIRLAAVARGLYPLASHTYVLEFSNKVRNWQSESILKESLELFSKNSSIANNLYSLRDMGKNEEKIASPNNLTGLKVLNFVVCDLKLKTSKGSSILGKVGIKLSPDPYMVLLLIDKSEMYWYRDRTINDLDCSEEHWTTTSSAPNKWQIVHVVEKDVRSIDGRLRICTESFFGLSRDDAFQDVEQSHELPFTIDLDSLTWALRSDGGTPQALSNPIEFDSEEVSLKLWITLSNVSG